MFFKLVCTKQPLGNIKEKATVAAMFHVLAKTHVCSSQHLCDLWFELPALFWSQRRGTVLLNESYKILEKTVFTPLTILLLILTLRASFLHFDFQFSDFSTFRPVFSRANLQLHGKITVCYHDFQTMQSDLRIALP